MILGTIRRLLRSNYGVEGSHQNALAFDRHRDCVGSQIRKSCGAGWRETQVEISRPRHEIEDVDPRKEPSVTRKGDAVRRVGRADPRVELSKRGRQPPEVVIGTRRTNVCIDRRERRTVQNSGESAD